MVGASASRRDAVGAYGAFAELDGRSGRWVDR